MISETVAYRIRDLKSQGRTQARIARELDISRATVTRVLCGKWKPRRFGARRVLRLLELWDAVLWLNPDGHYVGWCRACRQPVRLPCVACLARVLDSFGVRTPEKWLRSPCQCDGSFIGVGPPPCGAARGAGPVKQ